MSLSTTGSWLEVYREIAGRRGRGAEQLLEELKARFVREVVGSELPRAAEWVSHLLSAEERLGRVLGVKGVVYPKELKSFLGGCEDHLRKKLFIYAHDLARGRLTPDEFLERAGAAVRTSLLTNSRSLYQSWVFITLVAHLAERGFRLIYPDDMYLHLERSGRQRTGEIPPNAVLSDGYRALSLFVEAPRPVGWEDTGDLARAWKLYVALRPDMLAYGGRVASIVVPGGDPPVLRPDVVVECKELDDWYRRGRELKGPVVGPLTAEEWRDRWITGLYTGLAEVLNVQPSEVKARLRERRGLRLKDPQIVILYKRFYEPRRMVLVTRAPTPPEVRRLLEEEGVEVYDEVGFSHEKLEGVVDILEEAASQEALRADFVELTPAAKELLREALELLRRRGVEEPPPAVVERALKHLVSSLSSGEQPH